VGVPVYVSRTEAAGSRRGLVEDNANFILPLQVQMTFGSVDMAFNVGRTFHARKPGASDGWRAGIAAGRKFFRAGTSARKCSETSRNIDDGFLLLNVGAIYRVNEQLSFAVSVGRGIAVADQPDYVGFLGVSWLR